MIFIILPLMTLIAEIYSSPEEKEGQISLHKPPILRKTFFAGTQAYIFRICGILPHSTIQAKIKTS